MPVWAGVIPIDQVFGAPLPDLRLAPGTTWPGHLAPYGEGMRLDEVLTATAKTEA